MSAKLIGVGVGPGDPELLTIKAARAIQEADVIAYHCKPGGSSTAAAIASEYIREDQIQEVLEYPVTTGSTDHPGGYAGALADFYAQATNTLANHLAEGHTVAVLALGDPMLYSSYQHLHRALAADYPAEIIPGIPSVTAAADVLGQPLSEDKETVAILPGTMEPEALANHLRLVDAAVVMKLGRRFQSVRQAMIDAKVADRAYVVVRATMDDQRIIPLLEASAEDVPYFSVAVVPSAVAATSPQHADAQGEVVVLGLGPGAQRWTTPEVLAELRTADDVVGYSTYVRRVPERAGQRRHLSDNKVEAERAAMALDLAKRGRKVAVVSSGDPGVFAMAAAVLEVAEDPQFIEVPVRIIPGMTAAQAVASRVGAPLGHDFGMVSLSNRLKPFEIVERRVRALAGADMAFACYNPASKERRWQLAKVAEIVAEFQAPSTPVIVARAVGSDAEQVRIVPLADFDPEVVDMRTMVIFGASTTRQYEAPQGTRVYTSRYYT
ncbi:precorrin-3B C(17)-methyltransferase [Corynebacterium pelargi]|uniref:Precorrin-3B C(17)-methyltransferase n=1 Tax=Corynebacterium pelargi TaxID=1471400 RepID=A0A410W8W5_9CORY|nr:precorrin-3B C(17)-methyltransferase [Corynebacterium pelargi]QAU52397.1 Precorrin-3B C(17)-methyltransferase [Corynebacterium pelargi]GGG67967.1 putative cobalamin biosynthesis protein CobI [Corynebacterium pelargi]